MIINSSLFLLYVALDDSHHSSDTQVVAGNDQWIINIFVNVLIITLHNEKKTKYNFLKKKYIYTCNKISFKKIFFYNKIMKNIFLKEILIIFFLTWLASYFYLFNFFILTYVAKLLKKNIFR